MAAPIHGLAGLTTTEARRRLREFGPNELPREGAVSVWRIWARQFTGAMTWLLAGACVISLVLHELADAAAIGAIMLLNAFVGFFQEFRAERAVQALRSLTTPQARVVRDGTTTVIATTGVVPGDVLVLEAGDLVAADARLIEAHNLRTLEAALTGESVPVDKAVSPTAPETPLAERADHVFLGTAVAAGRGLAEVVATGMATEMGRIAHLLETAEDSKTPLQQQLAGVGRTLLVVCLGVVALVFALGLMRGRPWFELLFSSVALAVAAVPEGLPAMVTIALALGVQRMAARHALVRRLASVETLGCATVVCTDKTGTLTTGTMEVRDLWGVSRRELLFAAAACCDAELTPQGAVGDPTEVALLRAAAQRGIDRAQIEHDLPRISETPFDSERKWMSVRRADGRIYVKGAPEMIVPRCTSGTEGALAANAEMTGRALRVLAVAVGEGEKEEDLRMLGLVGMADPPRPEAVEAVARAAEAGIRTVMVTGDHPATARAIALEMGLLAPGQDPSGVFHARATAEDKIRLVRDLKHRGEVVAMTGDGVNDAPALREADIGIAMGRTGTEVTREAADMILTDDNFASIVAAIQEGRGIYDNIRKTLIYLMTGNAGELALMLGASLLALPLPLLPLQLLWINLVTDGPPALALMMDPADPGVLRRSPRPTREPMLGRAQWKAILIFGMIEASVVLSAFLWALRREDPGEARSLAFSTLVFCELFRVFAARSPWLLYWQVGVSTNLHLLWVVGVSGLLQMALPYMPLTAELFELRPVPLAQTVVAVALGLIPVTVMEVAKLLFAVPRRRRA